MPRRRRRSLSPIEDFPPDDDDDAFANEEMSPNSNRCPPQQRNAANARERARMRVLSKAFCRLKTTLPWVPADTKLSKLDTLRLASGYIAHLRTILADQPPDDMPSTRPLNLTWPFTFHQGPHSAWPTRGSPGAPPAPPPESSPCFRPAPPTDYYSQLQREGNFLRHAYSDSLLHSG